MTRGRTRQSTASPSLVTATGTGGDLGRSRPVGYDTAGTGSDPTTGNPTAILATSARQERSRPPQAVICMPGPSNGRTTTVSDPWRSHSAVAGSCAPGSTTVSWLTARAPARTASEDQPGASGPAASSDAISGVPSIVTRSRLRHVPGSSLDVPEHEFVVPPHPSAGGHVDSGGLAMVGAGHGHARLNRPAQGGSVGDPGVDPGQRWGGRAAGPSQRRGERAHLEPAAGAHVHFGGQVITSNGMGRSANHPGAPGGWPERQRPGAVEVADRRPAVGAEVHA